jgi:hypothetical protein
MVAKSIRMAKISLVRDKVGIFHGPPLLMRKEKAGHEHLP